MTAVLEHPAQPTTTAISFGPNWYATVMGTGIVAVAAIALPFPLPGRVPLATAFWLLSAGLLVAISVATSAHHRTDPATARGHCSHPAMMHFYGAPAMACCTVAAGTVLVGAPLLGEQMAWLVGLWLWLVGTAVGVATLALIPLRFRRLHPEVAPCGGWLMPVVPPTVSASVGALLLPRLDGAARTTLLLACVALLVVSLVAVVWLMPRIWAEVLRNGPGAEAAVPTLWIVLGPLGQSVTAVHHLGVAGGLATGWILAYGLPVLAAAALWALIALRHLAQAVRFGKLPFSMTWWSFTFPTGTVVTGLCGLAALTGSVALSVAAGIGFAGLLVVWATVAARTVAGLLDGRLLRG